MNTNNERNIDSKISKQNEKVNSYSKFIKNSLPLLLTEGTKSGAMFSIESYMNELLSYDLTKQNIDNLKETVNICKNFVNDNNLSEMINLCDNWEKSIEINILKNRINNNDDVELKEDNSNKKNDNMQKNIEIILESLPLLLDEKTKNSISFSIEIELNNLIDEVNSKEEFKTINETLTKCKSFSKDNNLYDLYELFKENEIKLHLKECKVNNEWNNYLMIKFNMNNNHIFIVDNEIYVNGEKTKHDDLFNDIVSIYNDYKNDLKYIWSKEMESDLIMDHSTTILNVTYGNYILNIDYAIKGVSEFVYSFVTKIYGVLFETKENPFIAFDTKNCGKLKFKKINGDDLYNEKIDFDKYNPAFTICDYSNKKHEQLVEMIDYIFEFKDKIIKEIKEFALECCNDWDEVDKDGDAITLEYIDNHFKISNIELYQNIDIYGELDDFQLLGGHSIMLSINFKTKQYNFDLIG